MIETKYEIIERDKDAQYKVLSTLVDKPVWGVAYLFMMAGEPLSAADIANFLMLSDRWFTGQFNQAVVELEVNGLVKEAEDEEAPWFQVS